MMALFAIATIGMTVACQKSDSTDDGHGDINASIVGTWKVERALLNDNIIPGETVNMNIIMNDDGTGKLESNVAQLPIADSLFDWGLNGTTLTIRMNGGQTLSYTVTKLTATECTIQGTVVPGFPTMTGNVRVDLSREAVNPNPNPEPNPNPNPNPEPVDNDPFPGATNWVFNYDQAFTFDYNGSQITAHVIFNNTLNFANTGAAGVLNIVGAVSGNIPEYGEQRFPLGPLTINFTYTYDSVTSTGTMTGAVTGATPETIPFTYNTSDNTIMVEMDVVPLVAELLAEYGDDLPVGIDNIPQGTLPEYFTFTRATK